MSDPDPDRSRELIQKYLEALMRQAVKQLGAAHLEPVPFQNGGIFRD